MCLVGPWFGYGVILPLFVLSAMLVVLKPTHASRRAGITTGGAALLALAVSVLGVWHLAAGAQAGDPSLVQYTQSWHIQPFSLHSWLRAVSFAATSTAQLFFLQDWLVPYRPASEGILLWGMAALSSVRYYAPDLAPPVVYAPIAAGVVPLGGQDDPTLLPNAASRAGRRWWLLTTNAPRWKRYQDLRTIVEEHGYAVEVAARGGLEDESGWTAELLVARRR